MLHHHAAIFDVIQSRIFRNIAGLRVANTTLEPKSFGFNGHRLLGDLRRILAATEHQHNIRRILQVGQRSQARLAQSGFAIGIDRNDLKTGILQISADVIAGAVRIIAESDNGDGAGIEHPSHGVTVVAGGISRHRARLIFHANSSRAS